MTHPGDSDPGQQPYPGQQAYPGQQPYPAPPQPGYPGYGAGQPPYGQAQPPYPPAQPPYGQPFPEYPGQPGYGRVLDQGLAEWWRRLLAWLIDSVILGIIAGLIFIPSIVRLARRLGRVTDRYPDLNTPAAQAAIRAADRGVLGTFVLLGLLSLAIALAYYWIQTAAWGATIGKRALGTRVVAAVDRSRIGAGAAGIRSAIFVIGPAIPIIGSLFWLVDNLWLLWDPSRQCLHDKAAGTVVIRKN